MFCANLLKKESEKNFENEIKRIVSLEMMQIEKHAKKAAEIGKRSICFTDFHTINHKDLSNSPESHGVALEALIKELKAKNFKASQGLRFSSRARKEKGCVFLDISW